MRLVPCYRRADASAPDGACVRLDDASEPEALAGKTGLWLESFDPRATRRGARLVARPVLNSLWLDEALWERYASALSRFDKIVLMPYRPGEASQRFEANLRDAWAWADAHGIALERRIVDVCVLPKRLASDVSIYGERAAAVRALGAASCGGVHNYVHGEPPEALPEAWAAFDALGLDFGLVGAAAARRYGLPPGRVRG